MTKMKTTKNKETYKGDAFVRNLARFRECNRESAWAYMVATGHVDTGWAQELQLMVDQNPSAFRAHMVELAKDCGVLASLIDYLPFSPKDGDKASETGLKNMVVMITEVIATKRQLRSVRARVSRKPRVSAVFASPDAVLAEAHG